MCKKQRIVRNTSLRTKLVFNLVPLFLIGEFAAIAIIGGLFVYNYFNIRNDTSNN